MTLAFSQELKGKPTYFPHKILHGLEIRELISFEYYQNEIRKFPMCTTGNDKIHTFREDSSNRWKAGVNIHFVINNRTKNRYQFAPVLPCISTQIVKIKYKKNKSIPKVKIDGKKLDITQIAQLAINDGFESINDFFEYFNTDTTKKLIHWTNFKY